jgi:DNA-binding NarL/FixJ family response regulator
MMSALSVVIVDREWSACHELRTKLPAESGIVVLAHASTIRQACEQIDAHAPEIVLMADRRDGLRGIAMLAALRRKRQNTRWIVVTENDDVETRVECVEAGADALLARDATPQEMQDTLSDVASGKNLLKGQAIGDLAMMQRLLQQVRQVSSGDRPLNRFDPNLSPCLLGVLDGVVQGWTNRQISEAEGIAEQTVKHHIANLKQRLGVRDRIGLVRHAVLHGWARMEPDTDQSPDEPTDEAVSAHLSSLAVIVQRSQRQRAIAPGLAASMSA